MNEFKKTLQNHFPGAKTIESITARAITKIESELNTTKEKILLATSICSDEINHNKHSFCSQFKSGEFIVGGLIGYPFAGKTGIGAYLSHVPESGAALIVFGPHIGISENGNIGFMKRNLQENETATCGALAGILNKIGTNTESIPEKSNHLDPQMNFVSEQLTDKKDAILNSSNPSIEIVKQSYLLIEKDIKQMVTSNKEAFQSIPIYLLGGILINTDDGFDDYFDEILFEKI